MRSHVVFLAIVGVVACGGSSSSTPAGSSSGATAANVGDVPAEIDTKAREAAKAYVAAVVAGDPAKVKAAMSAEAIKRAEEVIAKGTEQYMDGSNIAKVTTWETFVAAKAVPAKAMKPESAEPKRVRDLTTWAGGKGGGFDPLREAGARYAVELVGMNYVCFTEDFKAVWTGKGPLF